MAQTLKQITDEKLNSFYEEHLVLQKKLYTSKRNMLSYILGFISEHKEDLSKKDLTHFSEVYQQYLQSTDVIAYRRVLDGKPELSFWEVYTHKLEYWIGQIYPMLQELTGQERDLTPSRRLDLEANDIASTLYTEPSAIELINLHKPNKFNL